MIPWRSRELYVILSISLSAVMGVSLISPTLPVIKTVFGLSDVEAGYLITLYTLPAIFLAPLVGMLADRLGRRIVVVPSLFLFGGAGFTISLLNHYPLILGLRFVQGIGSTALALIARTLVGDLYEGKKQNAVMGLNDAVLALGAALFPFLGGYLAGFQWYYPFVLYGFPCLVGGYVGFALPPLAPESSNGKASYIKEGLKLLLNRKVGLLLAATFLAFVLLYGAIQTVLPLYLGQAFEYDPGSIGRFIAAMALTIAVTSFFNGYFARHLTSKTLIVLGFGAYGLGLIVLGVGRTAPGFVGGVILFGLGHGLTLPSMNTEIVRSVGAEARGAIMSLRTILSRLGQTTGPVLFPLLGVWFSYPGLFLIAGFVTTLAVIGSFAFRPEDSTRRG